MPPDPRSLCPQLNLLTPPWKKFLGMPLYAGLILINVSGYKAELLPWNNWITCQILSFNSRSEWGLSKYTLLWVCPINKSCKDLNQVSGQATFLSILLIYHKLQLTYLHNYVLCQAFELSYTKFACIVIFNQTIKKWVSELTWGTVWNLLFCQNVWVFCSPSINCALHTDLKIWKVTSLHKQNMTHSTNNNLVRILGKQVSTHVTIYMPG